MTQENTVEASEQTLYNLRKDDTSYITKNNETLSDNTFAGENPHLSLIRSVNEPQPKSGPPSPFITRKKNSFAEPLASGMLNLLEIFCEIRLGNKLKSTVKIGEREKITDDNDLNEPLLGKREYGDRYNDD